LITDKKEIIVLEVNGSPGLEGMQGDWPEKDLAKGVIEFISGTKGADAEPKVQAAELSTGDEQVVEPVPDQAPTNEPTISKDTIGEIETVSINRVTGPVEARIDTGAKYCSLHVDKVDVDGNMVMFTRGDVTYKVPVFKTVKIRHASIGDSVRRPVVKLDLTMRDIRLNQIEFTLNDRSSMKYEVLIGRNALQSLGLPVIVAKDEGAIGDRPESEVYDVEEIDEE
jgi:hypothetical protein